MSRNLWVYLTLTLLVVLSWIIADLIEPRRSPLQPSSGHQADSFSKRFTKLTMDENGKPKNKLFAEAMVHFKDDDSTELELPVFTYFKDRSLPWIIHSERGLISSNRIIRLVTKVKITREAAPGIEPVIINTTNLLINPNYDFAKTEDYAELISNHNQLSGVGLSLTFGENKRIKLHSQVKGKYDAH